VSANTAIHIPEDRILQIIAEGDARASEQAHLEGCQNCRAALTGLQDDLVRLRRKAALAAPVSERRFVLPAEPSGSLPVHRWRWGWATIGTVLSAVLLIVFLRTGGDQGLPTLPPTTPPLTAWEDPEMIEVNRLAENALPEAYLALSESLVGGYDEGFIDFLIPPLDEDHVS